MNKIPYLLRFKKKFFAYIGMILFIYACGVKQDVLYFQDIDLVKSSRPLENYTSVINADDMLTINVSALDQDAVRPFNLPAVSFIREDGDIGRAAQQTYLVDSNGNIDFPVLGTLKLGGLDRIEATNLIKSLLKEYIKDPIVNIRTINFKGSFTIPSERITILEALGLAGDLTIQGERKNVVVVREENGKKTYNRIDLTSEEIFNSKYYYLTQNDVIYVQPNNSRIKSSAVGPNVSATLSVISTLVTVAALIISITK